MFESLNNAPLNQGTIERFIEFMSTNPWLEAGPSVALFPSQLERGGTNVNLKQYSSSDIMQLWVKRTRFINVILTDPYADLLEEKWALIRPIATRVILRTPTFAGMFDAITKFQEYLRYARKNYMTLQFEVLEVVYDGQRGQRDDEMTAALQGIVDVPVRGYYDIPVMYHIPPIRA